MNIKKNCEELLEDGRETILPTIDSNRRSGFEQMPSWAKMKILEESKWKRGKK